MNTEPKSPFDEFLCERCGHAPSSHRLDDSRNVSPVDPAAEFRCLGPDNGHGFDGCWYGVHARDCPDFVAPPGYHEAINAHCASAS